MKGIHQLIAARLNLQEAHRASMHEVERLLDHLSVQLDMPNSWSTTTQSHRQRGNGTYVSIFKASNSVTGKNVAIKTLYPPQSNLRQRLQSEYDALRRKSVHGVQGFYARPLCFFDNSYATEWVEKQSMKSLYIRNLLSTAKKRNCIMKGAQWLRHYHHDDGHASLQPFDASALLETAIMRPCANPDWRGLVKAADAMAGHFGDVTTVNSWHHNDFSPGNLLTDGDNVVGLDFEMVDKADVLLDLSFFGIYIAAYLEPVAPRHKGAVFSQISSAVLDEYAVAHRFDERAYVFAALCNVLRRWAKHSTVSEDRGTPAIRRTWEAYCALNFSSLAADLCRKIES